MKFLNFLPQEALFYDLMKGLAHHAMLSSAALHAFVQGSDDSSRDKIIACREEAKRSLRTLVEEVCRTFITPFDREDLQELGEALYRISASMDGISQRIHVHQLSSLEGDFQRMSQILVQQSEHLTFLIDGLNRNEKPTILQERVALLYDLEDQGDSVALELEDLLFSHDPMLRGRDLIIRKDVYQDLEDATDAYRDAAAIALRIILKHS